MRYSDSAPLSGVVFRIRHGGIAGMIPEGWEAQGPRSGDDSSAALTLSKGDSLRIAFRPVSLDSTAMVYFTKNGIVDLASLTRTLHDSSVGTTRKGIKKFTSGERDCAAYEVTKGGRRIRVVVFPAGKYYYECEAWSLTPLSGPESYDRLFSAQQTVVKSLR